MKSRKAQATSVATFVVVLALFMLAYVLLLPEEQREGLIDLDDDDLLDEDDKVAEGTNILFTSPGDVFPYEKNELKIPINSVNIFATTEDDVTELATKITVSKSWFSDNPEMLTFKLDDPDLLEELQLFFFVNSGEGEIYIKFNGYTVFEGEISSTDSPIILPVDRAKTTNTLLIGMVSGDFQGDSYTLSSISIKETSKSEQSSQRRTFQLTSGEKAGLKKAELTYFVNCLKIAPEKQGDLTVLLNGRELTTEHVFCDAGTQTLTASTAYFLSGTNALEFKVTKGEYSIEGIEFEIDTKEKYYPQYNFELSDDEYDDIQDDDIDVFMEFKFSNDEDRKKATITVNEYQVSFDTRDDSYKRKISSYLSRGANYLKIIPKMEFEISSLRVYLAEED